MTLEASNVRVGISGRIYYAPLNTTAPESATDTLDGAFVDMGYITTDGLEFNRERSTSDIRAWQDSALIRTVQTEGTVTYTFTLMETKPEVIEAYFGSEMIDGKIELNPKNTGGRKSFVFDVVDEENGEVKRVRHYVPTGEITAVEAQTYVTGEAISYGMTVTAYIEDGRSADIMFSEYEDES